ncbi:MAG: DEAD/DEAH box helicase family protein [Elusimicrobiales bacterium]|nr:DEAD/DEAH box helicase family protein [Elusimicrobiales bacterium]
MLRDLDLKSVYDSSENDLVSDLMIPLLKNSIRYDRGVGFFTSGWLRLAAKGLEDFADNDGHARLITSPIISKEDFKALETGDAAKKDAVLYNILMNSVKDLASEFGKNPLNALAWLIADDVLSLKFAIPKGHLSGGDFHDKFAIFEDKAGDRVAIHGSYNDTAHASLNGEAFSVFKSWNDGQKDYVENHDHRFKNMWDDKNPAFNIYEIPDAVKENILRYRTASRPYKAKSEPIAPLFTRASAPILRDYQEEAFTKWEAAGYSGIFEMATGSGKTITAISCADRIKKKHGKIALIVSVPYLHLVDQWEKELEKFSFSPILCSSAHGDWERTLVSKIQDFNLNLTQEICCLAVHKTCSMPQFQGLVRSISATPLFGIFDEVHALGAKDLRAALSDTITHKVGLSATPARWFDDAGTAVLNKYFNGTCFEFTLEDAINKEFLVPYEYIPHLVELTDSEFSDYVTLSKDISRAFVSDREINENPYLQSLLRKRTALINNAGNKNAAFVSILTEELAKAKTSGERFSHALVYSPKGAHLDYLRMVADLGVKAHEFVAGIPADERPGILTKFSEGTLQALVAIRCLDEGVDIPSTKTAFIIASSTNPREFVQRRGRILRKSDGKTKAIIHDFITIPPLTGSMSDIAFKQNMLKREIPRFAEFTALALNHFEAQSMISKVLAKFESLELMTIKPWEVYARDKAQRKFDSEEQDD